MKKIAFSLFIAAATFSISGAYANMPEPESNSNPNDCGQYGVSYRVNTVNDPDKGYRESVVVNRPSNSSVNVQATVTRERRDNSTYNTQMDSRNADSHNWDWNDHNSMESNSGNGDRVTNVDMNCYPQK